MTSVRFGLTDMIIVLVMSAVLVCSVVPEVACRSAESANRIKCASNLRQIGLAIKMYANDEGASLSYPRTRYIPDMPPVFYTGVYAKNPFNDDGPQPNDITAAMFLILRTQDITTDVFVCPAGPAEKFLVESGKTIQDYSNFRNQNEIGYAMANPYPSSAAVAKGFKWDDSMSAGFAILADIGPGDQQTLAFPESSPAAKQRLMNAPGHDYDGQNVLYADGHCDWVTTAFQGDKSDNIYTYGGLDVKGKPISIGFVGAPASEIDSVILPSWDSSIPRSPDMFSKKYARAWTYTVLLAIGVGSVLAFICYLVWLGRKPHRI